MAAAGGAKWTGGLKDMLLDCPVGPLWELASDWAHWDRFYPSTDFQFVSELKEGENRKPGCLRYAEVAAGMWTNERLLAIDNDKYYFSYNMEDNVFCGGLEGYVAKVQWRGTADGKTMLEYWNYEVEPLTTMSREAFTAFIGGFLSQKLVKGLEAAAREPAAGAIQPKPVAEGEAPKPVSAEPTTTDHHHGHHHSHTGHHHGHHHDHNHCH